MRLASILGTAATIAIVTTPLALYGLHTSRERDRAAASARAAA